MIDRRTALFDDVAVTVSPDGRFLFVGMGSSFISNVVLSYRIDPFSGQLSLISRLTSPTISLPLRLSQLSVSPQGNLLAVSYTSVAGYVALYKIDPNGFLSELDLLPDQAPFGRAQGLAWSPDGLNLYAALVNNRPASVAGIGMSVLQNTTLGLEWTLRSDVSDDSNLIAIDPSALNKLFFSTQMPAVVVANRPLDPPTISVSLSSSAFVPSLLDVEFGTTVAFTATVPGLSVVQVSSAVSCLPKAQGFNSGPLVPGQPWLHTFDVAGSYYIADASKCITGLRMLVVVRSQSDWIDPAAQVNPIRARATTLDVTFDGDHVIASLQTGGVTIQRVLPNFTLAEVAFATYDAQGLQSTAAAHSTPPCCKNDDTGPILQWEPVVNVPCDYKITSPFVKLVAGCDWQPDQVRVQGVQIPTCNAQCDALFRVTLTDLCGQTSEAVQYIKHDPDTQPPIISGGVTQSVQCVLNATLQGNASALVLSDQCQPVSSLSVTQQLGPTFYQTPLQCRVDKRTASRSVTWSVTDPCNNTATATGTITSIDTLAPVLTIANYTVPCPLADKCFGSTDNGGVLPEWSGYATANDLCWGPLATNFVDVFPSSPSFTFGCDSFQRVWSATDYCGNVGTATQTISFERGQSPVFVAPPDITVECGVDLGFDRTGYPTIEAPPCVDLTKRVDTFRVPSSNVCRRTTLRRFSASKTVCGQWSAEAIQNITEIDTSGPSILMDHLIHITCEDGEDIGPNNTNIGYPVALDACQGVLPTSRLTYVDSVVHIVRRPPHCLDQVTRTWFATDPCGNTSNATQIIYATRHCQPCSGIGGKPCV